MLITTKRRYIKKHVIGGAGIFDTVANFLKRMVGSTAAKALASKLSSAAQTEIGKKAIEAGKSAVKEIGFKAIDVGKDIAVKKVKDFIDKAAPKTSSTTQEVIKQADIQKDDIRKAENTIASLINMYSKNEATTNNSNTLLAGSGVRANARANAKANAISIQELVKRLNASDPNTGSGLRLA